MNLEYVLAAQSEENIDILPGCLPAKVMWLLQRVSWPNSGLYARFVLVTL